MVSKRKPFLLLPLLLFAFCCTLVIGGCKEKEAQQAGAKLATTGQTLAEAALKTYDDLDHQTQVQSELENYLHIIVQPPTSVATAPLPKIQLSDFQKQIRVRQAAYKSFKNMYSAFFKLSDTAFGDQSEEAAKALKSSYESLKGMPELPSTVNDQLPGIASLLTQRIQAKDIKKHNLALYRICQAYETLWNADKAVWSASLDEEYNSFANSLTSIPADHFDTNKLNETVKEPLTLPYQASLYKREVLKEYRGQQLKVKSEMDLVSRAFGLLKTVHEQLAAQKTRPSFSDLSALLDHIEPILQDVLN